MSKIIAALNNSVTSLTKLINELGENASWSPLDKGRTALDQVAECALIAGFAAGIIQSKEVPPVDWAAFETAKQGLAADAAATLAALAAKTGELTAVLEGLSADDAAFEVTLPWGEVVTLAGLADVVYWNNTYHEGQINYIQTLLG